MKRCSRHPCNVRARIAFAVALVPFLYTVGLFMLHFYEQAIGDPEFFRPALGAIALLGVVSFLFWIAGFFLATSALRQDRSGAKSLAIGALILLAVPFCVAAIPALRMWHAFLTEP